MKKQLLFAGLILLSFPGLSQTAWNVTGNATTSGDYIGTNNSEDFIIKTNGTTAVKVKPNGNVVLKALEGNGTGLTTFDNNGKLFPLSFTGDNTQILLGDGTWGVPASLWQTNGSKIYYSGGKVGIGTSTPNYKLDVNGDVRITQNLYLQGGMIIADKQVKSKSLRSDSIMVDSSAFYGNAKFKGEVKVQSKLEVVGDATVNGTFTADGSLKTNGGVFFGGNKELSFTPPVGGSPAAFGWGVPSSYTSAVMGLSYCFSPTPPVVNLFNGMTYSLGLNGSGFVNVMRTGFDGANGIVDMAGTADGADPRLLLNYYCGKDVDICTGPNGGTAATGKNFEVGFPDRDANIAVNVKAIDKTGQVITTSHATAYGYNTLLNVNRADTKAMVVSNSGSENFSIYGDGKTMIGTGSPQAQLDVNGNLRIGSLAGTGTNVVQVDNNGFLTVMPLSTAGVGFWTSTTGGSDIYHNTGKVGIGTTAPADLLQVGNGSNRLVSGTAGSADLGYGTSYLGFNADRSPSGTWTVNNDGVHNGGTVMYSNIFGDMYFATVPNNGGSDQTKTDAEIQAATKLFISADGNVGIGTIHPDGYKFSVNGTMRAKDITVKVTGWSDFVFEEDYSRMNLLEKETFYKREKHLPNINRAQEMVNNGLEVGTTMNGMMQNIEENTLDLVDLYKKFIILEKENAELKKRVSQLEATSH